MDTVLQVLYQNIQHFGTHINIPFCTINAVLYEPLIFQLREKRTFRGIKLLPHKRKLCLADSKYTISYTKQIPTQIKNSHLDEKSRSQTLCANSMQNEVNDYCICHAHLMYCSIYLNWNNEVSITNWLEKVKKEISFSKQEQFVLWPATYTVKRKGLTLCITKIHNWHFLQNNLLKRWKRYFVQTVTPSQYM